MTIKICGPLNSRYANTGSMTPHLDLAIECDVSEVATLSDAIRVYENQFFVEINIMVEPLFDFEENRGKYFWLTDTKSNRVSAVDIHVFRDENEICPKQNLEFKLQDNDIIEIGQLIC